MMELIEVPPQSSPSPATTPGLVDEFLQSGRTGRRNALTDDEEAKVEKNLEQSLLQLSCSDEPSTSGQQGVQLRESSNTETTNTQSGGETVSSGGPTNTSSSET